MRRKLSQRVRYYLLRKLAGRELVVMNATMPTWLRPQPTNPEEPQYFFRCRFPAPPQELDIPAKIGQ